MLMQGWPLLLISFLEGGALMAVELIGAKLLAPFYGNSIYVWSAVLGTTLGGLALGYFLGGEWASKPGRLNKLKIGLLISMVLCALLPWYSQAILNLTIGMDSLQMGVLISSFVILTPPLLLFGTVSPLVIQLLNSDSHEAGTATGLVYATSTFGGILCTFSFAFYLMPYAGLKMSCWITTALLLMALLCSFSGALTKLEQTR